MEHSTEGGGDHYPTAIPALLRDAQHCTGATGSGKQISKRKKSRLRVNVRNHAYGKQD